MWKLVEKRYYETGLFADEKGLFADWRRTEKVLFEGQDLQHLGLGLGLGFAWIKLGLGLGLGLGVGLQKGE